LAWPSWRWMTLSETPSRASSTACAWRSWCGAKRRLTPASRACRRNSLRTAAADQRRPRVGPSMMQNSGPAGSTIRSVSQGRRLSQPHPSIPTSRRRPPLPRRTSTEPRRGQDRAHSERAPPGREGLRAKASRSSPAAASRERSHWHDASRRRSPQRSVDRPDTASPCCGAHARHGSRGASPVSGAAQQNRALTTRSWVLLPFTKRTVLARSTTAANPASARLYLARRVEVSAPRAQAPARPWRSRHRPCAARDASGSSRAIA